jgi:hypothetical protein
MKLISSIAAALFLCHAPADASLISLDFHQTGDGLLTMDSSTGLKWLDVGATLGLTAPQVMAGEGGWATSFRYATSDELRTLFMNSGLLLLGNYNLPEEAAAQQFLNLFSNGPEDCSNFVCGFIANPQGTVDFANVGVIHNTVYDGGYSYIWSNLGDAQTFGGPSWGSFLVLQQSVPEPSTLALAVLALTSAFVPLSCFRRRQTQATV